MSRFSRIWVTPLAFAAAALIFPFIPAAAMAEPPTALGPEAPISTVPGTGFQGRITVSPTHGPVGTPVTVTASGLPANTDVQLVWRTVTGHWNVSNATYNGRTFDPVAYRIAAVKTDANGKASASFTAPEDFGFTHDVVVQQGKTELTQTGFYIDMSVDVSPRTAPEGTPLTVDVKGIGWRKLHNSWQLLYDNKYTGWISSVTTGGSAHFTIPAAGQPGTHVLEVIHGGFTFPYRNMQQSPEPDRPQFMIPVTITSDPAVVPPPPQDQAQTEIRRLPKEGALKVSPAFAPVDTPITVTGGGFTPGKSYDLDWTTVTGNRVSGGGWEEASHVVANAKADSKGDLSFSLKTPDDLGGNHTVYVKDGAKKVSGSVWIQATALPLKIGEGPAGTPFTIHLKGVGWTETANIFTIDYDNAYVGYSCGFNSQGDVVVHMTASGAPGWHYIDLRPAIYKGKENGPRNFRLPQLTYKADHPGEDLPRFRYAFKVTPKK